MFYEVFSFFQTIAEDNSENIRCPVARMDDDELEIADFRIFGDSEINEKEKLQEKNYHEVCLLNYRCRKK